MSVTVRTTRDPAEIEAARKLRIEVFSGEQGVDPALEDDGKDDQSTQVIALDDSGIVATCRLRYPAAEECKLERMVVAKRFRKLGVGARLLAGAEEEGRSAGAQTMVLNAQRRAEAFYAANGYVAEGDTFLDAGIEHVRMRKAL